MQEEYVIFLCNAPAFTFKHCESQRRSWECARAFWRIAKRIQIESFCWKYTILDRCLNRVGFEFWYLSRNRKGHVSSVKCRRIIGLSSETPSFSNSSFCPLWPVCHLREHFYMCSTNSSHTHMFATYLTTLCFLTSIVFSSFSLSLLLWCVPPSPSMCSVMAKLLSWWPRTVVEPQLWSSSRTGANKEAKNKVRKRIKYTHG